MTAAERSALDKWSRSVDDRSIIESFMAWAGENGLTYRSTMPLGDLLDRFHGIDRKDLEAGRRALLGPGGPF